MVHFWLECPSWGAILTEAMAASSGDGIPAQLAALLGRDVAHIRKTEEEPPRAAVYDVIAADTGMTVNHAGKAYRDLVARHPEVHSMGVNFRFPGRGQRKTPVAPKATQTSPQGTRRLPLSAQIGLGPSPNRPSHWSF